MKSINKLYERVKEFIKNNYIQLIILSLVIILFNFKLDYEIYTYGSPINLSKRIEIDSDNKASGSFYLTYVEARPGNIPFILLSKIIPSWDLVSLNDSRIENESAKDIQERGKIDLYTVNEYAVKNAFDAANVLYLIENKELVVYYIFESAETNLEIGDVIKKVDGISFNDVETLNAYINTKMSGDKVNIKALRDDKEVNLYGIVKNKDENKIIGLYLVTRFKINPSIKVDFKYKSSESGPSGGLMSALEIYNRITKEDISKGLKIAGTGTINYDGEVGSVGGVKYKLLGAVKNKMDVFIVPSGENYEEVLKLVNDNNYSIRLIEAKNFKQVLNDLQNI